MRTMLVAIIAGVLLALLCVPGGAARGGEQGPINEQQQDGMNTQTLTGEEEQEYITGEFDKVGMDTGEIHAVGDGRFLVDVEKLEPGNNAMTSTGKFRPCTLKVKLENGRIQLERCGLEDAGLVPDTKRFPSSLKIEDGDIWGRPQ